MNIDDILDAMDEMLDRAWNLPLTGGRCVVAVSYTHLDVYKRQIFLSRIMNVPLLRCRKRMSKNGRRSRHQFLAKRKPKRR